MSARQVPHRLTVIQYERMIDVGILKENDRVELIRGEIVAKMPIGNPHASCVKRLNKLFGKLLADHAIVSVQDPIRLADSEPEPDMALLTPRYDFYATAKPIPEDILLLIEVADNSLEVDRELKRALYAENAIGEYWILNLVDHCLEVFRKPQPDGTYAETSALLPGDSITLLALPNLTLKVEEILGR